jgi:hypothetical protein
MSYTGRKKYKSRKEKAEEASRNVKAIVMAIILFVLVLIFYKRVDIMDYIYTFIR